MIDPVYPGTQLEIEAFVKAIPSRLAAAAAAGASTITVYDGSRYGNGDTLKLRDGDPQDGPSEIVTLHASAAVAGNVLTLAAGTSLARGHGVNTKICKLSAATIAAAIELPDATTAALTLNSVSTGRYRGTYTTTSANSGANTIEVNATGAAIGAAALPFSVLADLVA